MNFVSPVRVLIADDHPLVRAGVAATLNDPEAYQIVGQAKNTAETLAMVLEHRPHLLILDLQMEDFRPASLIQQCLEFDALLKVLILSSRSNPDDLAPLQHLGIHGFLVKEEGPDCLLQAVRVVLSGQQWFSQQVSQNLKIMREENRNSALPAFSTREMQVVRELVRGKDNQAIADALQLSKNSIRRYVTQIFQKLDVKNRMEAVVRLNERGIS
ncbi:MAG: response regulator transcription factor [Candidatus Eremiobacteraeota bacterium]|nr:response regulator transcription factor [Candidatus Eremiobacteraeota bacterium]